MPLVTVTGGLPGHVREMQSSVRRLPILFSSALSARDNRIAHSQLDILVKSRLLRQRGHVCQCRSEEFRVTHLVNRAILLGY